MGVEWMHGRDRSASATPGRAVHAATFACPRGAALGPTRPPHPSALAAVPDPRRAAGGATHGGAAMTLPAFPTLVLVAALIVETALIVWLLVLGIQARADARRSRAALDMTLYERPELPRRPGEFGPLYRP